MLTDKAKAIYKVTDTQILGFFDTHKFLSNYHPQPILYNGLLYKNNEAAYQAQKTHDPNKRLEFIYYSPEVARRKGREIKPLREDWLKPLEAPDPEGLIVQIRDQIMYEINVKKYFRNIGLGQALLDTGDKYLEETNWWRDDYWGVFEGQGLNKLGRILMKVREELRKMKREAA